MELLDREPAEGDDLESRDLAGSGIALMGHSMGAVAVLLAAAGRDHVRAVVVEAPFDTYRNTVARHARLLYGLPSWVPLIPLSIRVAEWRAGFDADTVDAVAAASRVDAPLLAIVDGEDERMPEPVVRRIVEAHPGPNALWVASAVGHVGAIFHPDWASVVLGFLTTHGVLGESSSPRLGRADDASHHVESEKPSFLTSPGSTWRARETTERRTAPACTG